MTRPSPTGGETSLAAVAGAVSEQLAGPCGVAEGTGILAACSGGADSVVLVAALSAVAHRWPLVAVGFVDHGLRDVTAERRAARQAAERAGVPLIEQRVEIAATGNKQQAARRARYLALEAMTTDRALVATGHTLTDQAETVLQRLVRGAGLRGLVSIPNRAGLIVRPLLTVRRATTRSVAVQLADHAFADDPTNATRDYQRNRLRHDVLPVLMAENAAADINLASAARHAAEELALLDALLDRLAPATVDLTSLEPAAAEALIRWRIRREMPAARPPGSPAVAAFVERLVAGEDTTASLGDGVRATSRSGRIVLEEDVDPRRVLVAPCPGSYGLATLALEVHEGSQTRSASGEPDEDHDNDDWHVLWLDRAKVVWPLTLGSPSSRSTPVLRDGAGALLWPRQADASPTPAQPTSDSLCVRFRTTQTRTEQGSLSTHASR